MPYIKRLCYAAGGDVNTRLLLMRLLDFVHTLDEVTLNEDVAAGVRAVYATALLLEGDKAACIVGLANGHKIAA